MKWILLVLIFAGGLFFIFKQKKAAARLPPPPSAASLPAPNESLPERDPGRSSNLDMGKEARKRLYTLAGDPNDKVRWSALELLYRTGDPNASSIIKDRLAHESENWIKRSIIQMLAQNKDKENLELLAPTVSDVDGDIRLAGVVALSGFDSAEVVPYLSKALEDSDAEVKLKAMEGLKNINTVLDQRRRDYERALAEKAAAEAAARQAAEGKRQAP